MFGMIEHCDACQHPLADHVEFDGYTVPMFECVACDDIGCCQQAKDILKWTLNIFD